MKKQKKKYKPGGLSPTAVANLPNVTKEEGFKTFGFTTPDRGLRIKKFHHGQMNWYVSYKFDEIQPVPPYYYNDDKNVKHHRITIGRYPDMHVSRAREIHKKFKDNIALGVNPKDMKNYNLDVSNTTVEELVEIYFEKLVQDEAKSIRSIKNMIKNNYGDIAKLYVNSVSTGQIKASVDRIIDRGSMSSARVYQKYLRTLFNIAVDWNNFEMKNKPKLGFTIKESPVPKPKKIGKREQAIQKTKNAKWLTDKDINLLVNDEKIKLIDRLHMKLVISTGQRLKQIREATRGEIDLNKGFWLWAADNTKKLEAHDIPLTPLHIDIIEQVYEIVDDECEYLFPAVRDKRNPIHDHAIPTEIADHQLRLGKNEEKFFKAKHFRHTFKTLCAEMGIDRDWVDKVQHHATEYGSAPVYDHYQYIKEKRAVLEAWCERMEEVFAPDWKAE